MDKDILLTKVTKVNRYISAELLQDEEVRLLLNCTVSNDAGKPTRRGGFTKYISTILNNIKSIFSFNDNIYATTSTSLYKYNVSGNNWTLISNSFGGKVTYVSYNDRLYLTTGSGKVKMLYNDVLKDAEVEVFDSSQVTVTCTRNGSLSGIVRWIFVYRRENGSLGGFTYPIAAFHGRDTTLNNNRVTFTNIPTPSDTDIKVWELYKSVNGSPYYYLDSFRVERTTYEDAGTEVDMSKDLEYIAQLSDVKYLELHRERLYYGNFKKAAYEDLPPCHSSDWSNQNGREAGSMGIPTSNGDRYAVSSDAQDTTGGNGLRKLGIYYSNFNGETKYIEADMNGTTNVLLSADDIKYVHKLIGVEFGSSQAAVGNVKVMNASYQTMAQIDAENTETTFTFCYHIYFSGGSMTPNSAYKYKIGFRFQNGTYSKLSTQLVVNLPAGYSKVRLIAFPIPHHQSRVAKIILARTKANQNTFYIVKEVDTNAIEIDDDTADSSLTTIYQESEIKTIESSIMFSELYKPEEVRELNYVTITPEDEQNITGICDDTDGILIFKSNSICKLYTQGATETWIAAKLLSNIGADDGTIIKHSGKYYFLYIKQMYRYPDSLETPISLVYNDIFKSVSEVIDKTYCWQWILYLVKIGDENKIIIYDTIFNTFYLFETAIGTLEADRQLQCLGYVQNKLVAGGNYVYYYDSGSTTDDGQDYSMLVQTKSYVIDGIAIMRLRLLYLDFDKLSNKSVSVSLYADGSYKTYNVSSGSGRRRVKLDTDSMTPGTFRRVRDFYLTVAGDGLSKLNNLRIRVRPLREGYAIKQ